MVRKENISIIEKKERQKGNGFIALIVSILLISIILLLVVGFKLRGYSLGWSIAGILLFYIVVLSFLFEPKTIRETIKTIVETIEKPIRVPFVKTIEKPVIKIKEVEKPIFIEPKKKKEFNYVASTETKTYHENDCRFSKLIKKNYKLMDDEEVYFKRLKYTPCKSCIKKIIVKKGKHKKSKK
ncbi:hypothetical protein HOD75_01035 [archaeon]|nr:hypothetical protein [archaeon]MBT4241462.1 hypothetical protein [archaeon]MBT4417667.1 hypothetical protein [archaeon]